MRCKPIYFILLKKCKTPISLPNLTVIIMNYRFINYITSGITKIIILYFDTHTIVIENGGFQVKKVKPLY